jgi:hypothetical protein
VETINREELKELIKEMIRDEEIMIFPVHHKDRHWNLSSVSIQVVIDDEVVQEN